MKQPKLRDVKVNLKETARIRSSSKKQKSVKITINIDSDSLSKLRKMSAESGVPYQRLLNSMLKQSLTKGATSQSRIERIEREIEFLKRKLAA